MANVCAPKKILPGWHLIGVLAVVSLLGGAGCSASDEGSIGSLSQGLICKPGGNSVGMCQCNPGAAGGDLTCECTDNNQCNWHDFDTRLVICQVPTGGTIGTCVDCLAFAAGTRPEGCACNATTDCAGGLACNGRTCQVPRSRGEFCLFDADCGSDGFGAMTCDKTMHLCGRQLSDFYCNFSDDCLAGGKGCIRGVCASGGEGANCWKDADCSGGTVCSTAQLICMYPLFNGDYCVRNQECQAGVCNSVLYQCGVGDDGTWCSTANPGGANFDCAPGFTCLDCGDGARQCRPNGATTCI